MPPAMSPTLTINSSTDGGSSLGLPMGLIIIMSIVAAGTILCFCYIYCHNVQDSDTGLYPDTGPSKDPDLGLDPEPSHDSDSEPSHELSPKIRSFTNLATT